MASNNVKVGTLGGKGIYATPTGLRVGRGRVQSPKSIYAVLPKGEARRLRKMVRKAGYRSHAGA